MKIGYTTSDDSLDNHLQVANKQYLNSFFPHRTLIPLHTMSMARIIIFMIAVLTHGRQGLNCFRELLAQ
jgi:hypothetical protein